MTASLPLYYEVRFSRPDLRSCCASVIRIVTITLLSVTGRSIIVTNGECSHITLKHWRTVCRIHDYIQILELRTHFVPALAPGIYRAFGKGDCVNNCIVLRGKGAPDIRVQSWRPEFRFAVACTLSVGSGSQDVVDRAWECDLAREVVLLFFDNVTDGSLGLVTNR